MTEKLKTLMDRSADVDFPALDLEAITARGERVGRRRRGALVLAGTAAAAVTALAAVLVAGGDEERADDAASTPSLAAGDWTWTEGSTLHTPRGTVDLGRPVVGYVRTTAGLVFVGPDRGVYSYAGGDVTRIGEVAEIAEAVLRSDRDGTLVAWVTELPGDGGLRTVVHDQGTGEQVWTGEAEGHHPVIDGRTVYLRDPAGHGVTAVDVDSGRRTPLGDAVTGAEDGVLAAESARGTRIVAPGRGRVVDALGNVALFSPDSRWVSVDDDQQAVFDTSDGRQLELDVPGEFSVGYEWLDASTLMVMASPDPDGAQLQLFSCRVPDGACQRVADIGAVGDRIAVPAGEAFWGAAGASS